MLPATAIDNTYIFAQYSGKLTAKAIDRVGGVYQNACEPVLNKKNLARQDSTIGDGLIVWGKVADIGNAAKLG